MLVLKTITIVIPFNLFLFFSGFLFFILFYYYFIFSFLATPWHMEFPGQGSDLSCSCDLSHSCGNARSLTGCARPGIKSASQCSKDTTNPIVPQQEFLKTLLFLLCSLCGVEIIKYLIRNRKNIH